MNFDLDWFRNLKKKDLEFWDQLQDSSSKLYQSIGFVNPKTRDRFQLSRDVCFFAEILFLVLGLKPAVLLSLGDNPYELEEEVTNQTLRLRDSKSGETNEEDQQQINIEQEIENCKFFQALLPRLYQHYFDHVLIPCGVLGSRFKATTIQKGLRTSNYVLTGFTFVFDSQNPACAKFMSFLDRVNSGTVLQQQQTKQVNEEVEFQMVISEASLAQILDYPAVLPDEGDEMQKLQKKKEGEDDELDRNLRETKQGLDYEMVEVTYLDVTDGPSATQIVASYGARTKKEEFRNVREHFLRYQKAVSKFMKLEMKVQIVE